MATTDKEAGVSAPGWIWHNPNFASLMLGRVDLAQIERGNSEWFWTLRFCTPSERSLFSDRSLKAAQAVCEAHAARVLGLADQAKADADPLNDALLRFYKAILAEWAGPSRQRRAAILTATEEVQNLLYPGEPVGGMPFGGQSL